MYGGADVRVGLMCLGMLTYYDAGSTSISRESNDIPTNPSTSPKIPASKLHVLTAYYIVLAESVKRAFLIMV